MNQHLPPSSPTSPSAPTYSSVPAAAPAAAGADAGRAPLVRAGSMTDEMQLRLRDVLAPHKQLNTLLGKSKAPGESMLEVNVLVRAVVTDVCKLTDAVRPALGIGVVPDATAALVAQLEADAQALAVQTKASLSDPSAKNRQTIAKTYERIEKSATALVKGVEKAMKKK